MVEDAYNRVVEYLEKQGPANTFKLASDLNIDRDKILNVIEKLREKQVIEFRFGTVQLLKVPKKKESVRPKKPKKARKTPLKEVLEEKIRDLENIQENLRDENNELKKRLSKLETGIEKQPKQPKVKRHPKIKRRPRIKRRVKKRAEKRPCKKIPRHRHRVRKLKRGVKKLKQKAKIHHKIIGRTIKNIIKKFPAKFRKKE